MGREVKAEKRNWYSEDALGEKRISSAGSVVLQHYLVCAAVLRVDWARAACHECALGAAR